jgi:hypothetical protein
VDEVQIADRSAHPGRQEVDEQVTARIEAFRPGLRELGYVEGKNKAATVTILHADDDPCPPPREGTGRALGIRPSGARGDPAARHPPPAWPAGREPCDHGRWWLARTRPPSASGDGGMSPPRRDRRKPCIPRCGPEPHGFVRQFATPRCLPVEEVHGEAGARRVAPESGVPARCEGPPDGRLLRD